MDSPNFASPPTRARSCLGEDHPQHSQSTKSDTLSNREDRLSTFGRSPPHSGCTSLMLAACSRCHREFLLEKLDRDGDNNHTCVNCRERQETLSEILSTEIIISDPYPVSDDEKGDVDGLQHHNFASSAHQPHPIDASPETARGAGVQLLLHRPNNTVMCNKRGQHPTTTLARRQHRYYAGSEDSLALDMRKKSAELLLQKREDLAMFEDDVMQASESSPPNHMPSCDGMVVVCGGADHHAGATSATGEEAAQDHTERNVISTTAASGPEDDPLAPKRPGVEHAIKTSSSLSATASLPTDQDQHFGVVSSLSELETDGLDLMASQKLDGLRFVHDERTAGVVREDEDTGTGKEDETDPVDVHHQKKTGGVEASDVVVGAERHAVESGDIDHLQAAPKVGDDEEEPDEEVLHVVPHRDYTVGVDNAHFWREVGPIYTGTAVRFPRANFESTEITGARTARTSRGNNDDDDHLVHATSAAVAGQERDSKDCCSTTITDCSTTAHNVSSTTEVLEHDASTNSGASKVLLQSCSMADLDHAYGRLGFRRQEQFWHEQRSSREEPTVRMFGTSGVDELYTEEVVGTSHQEEDHVENYDVEHEDKNEAAGGGSAVPLEDYSSSSTSAESREESREIKDKPVHKHTPEILEEETIDLFLSSVLQLPGGGAVGATDVDANLGDKNKSSGDSRGRNENAVSDLNIQPGREQLSDHFDDIVSVFCKSKSTPSSCVAAGTSSAGAVVPMRKLTGGLPAASSFSLLGSSTESGSAGGGGGTAKRSSSPHPNPLLSLSPPISATTNAQQALKSPQTRHSLHFSLDIASKHTHNRVNQSLIGTLLGFENQMRAGAADMKKVEYVQSGGGGGGNGNDSRVMNNSTTLITDTSLLPVGPLVQNNKSNFLLEEEDDPSVEHERAPCRFCGRKFRVDRLEVHESMCLTKNAMARPTWDSRRQRLKEIPALFLHSIDHDRSAMYEHLGGGHSSYLGTGDHSSTSHGGSSSSSSSSSSAAYHGNRGAAASRTAGAHGGGNERGTTGPSSSSSSSSTAGAKGTGRGGGGAGGASSTTTVKLAASLRSKLTRSGKSAARAGGRTSTAVGSSSSSKPAAAVLRVNAGAVAAYPPVGATSTTPGRTTQAGGQQGVPATTSSASSSSTSSSKQGNNSFNPAARSGVPPATDVSSGATEQTTSRNNKNPVTTTLSPPLQVNKNLDHTTNASGPTLKQGALGNAKGKSHMPPEQPSKDEDLVRKECPHCHRFFRPEALEVHRRVCISVFGTKQKMKPSSCGAQASTGGRKESRKQRPVRARSQTKVTYPRSPKTEVVRQQRQTAKFTNRKPATPNKNGTTTSLAPSVDASQDFDTDTDTVTKLHDQTAELNKKVEALLNTFNQDPASSTNSRLSNHRTLRDESLTLLSPNLRQSTNSDTMLLKSSSDSDRSWANRYNTTAHRNTLTMSIHFEHKAVREAASSFLAASPEKQRNNVDQSVGAAGPVDQSLASSSGSGGSQHFSPDKMLELSSSSRGLGFTSPDSHLLKMRSTPEREVDFATDMARNNYAGFSASTSAEVPMELDPTSPSNAEFSTGNHTDGGFGHHGYRGGAESAGAASTTSYLHSRSNVAVEHIEPSSSSDVYGGTAWKMNQDRTSSASAARTTERSVAPETGAVTHDHRYGAMTEPSRNLLDAPVVSDVYGGQHGVLPNARRTPPDHATVPPAYYQHDFLNTGRFGAGDEPARVQSRSPGDVATRNEDEDCTIGEQLSAGSAFSGRKQREEEAGRINCIVSSSARTAGGIPAAAAPMMLQELPASSYNPSKYATPTRTPTKTNFSRNNAGPGTPAGVDECQMSPSVTDSGSNPRTPTKRHEFILDSLETQSNSLCKQIRDCTQKLLLRRQRHHETMEALGKREQGGRE